MATPNPDVPIEGTLPDESEFIISLHDDIHEAIRRIDELNSAMADMSARQQQLVESHNKVGANVAWIVSNVQGIFQMFNDPAAMSNIMSLMSPMVGGVINGGQEGRGNGN